jgi:hypothetical protein
MNGHRHVVAIDGRIEGTNDGGGEHAAGTGLGNNMDYRCGRDGGELTVATVLGCQGMRSDCERARGFVHKVRFLNRKKEAASELLPRCIS